MIIHSEKQCAPEWRARRCGKITTSRLGEIVTAKQLKPSAQCDAYLDQLVAEHWLGRPLDDAVRSPWIDRGVELEPEARDAFSFVTGREAREVGFVQRDEAELLGTSCDSLIFGPDDTLLGVHELKCPAPKTHVAYWRLGTVPTAYHLQTQGELWVTGLDRGWFQSYHPDGPDVIIEFGRDDKTIAAFEEHVPAALDRLAALLERWQDAGNELRSPWDWAAEQEVAL